MQLLRSVVSLVLLAILVLPSVAQEEEVSFHAILSALTPKSPPASLACLKVRGGFRVELVCAEPLVSDPIAIDWGPDGRLWVVEMGDYPSGANGDAETDEVSYGNRAVRGRDAALGGGRVRVLEDTDRDGKYDKSTIFLDGLSFPTGVMAWNHGVLITCAPDIFYAEDTDGDGKADRCETLFHGFVEGNPQHRVNGLRWGLENWIYGANGDSGGIVTSLKTGKQVDIHARDFRLRVETGELETQTGMAQYGRCRDDWGNWYGGRNLQPIWHCALDDQYLRRNPFLVPPDPCVDLMDPPTCAPVFPISYTLPRFNEFWTLNRFTAACGITLYRDDLFGPEFANTIFVCEPTYNLVHRSVLHTRGTTFFSRRAPDEQQSEFLASTDHWFRPVQARTGPDGALWVVDMYRLIIEHPDYIPAKWHKELDFEAGRGRGRIYRVLPEGVQARRFRSLSGLLTVPLVHALDHPNGPRRDMIQQMLVRSQDRSAIEPLRKLTLSNVRPKARLSALCTLDGLEAIDVAFLLQILGDPHPALRRHAIRLAEPLIDESLALQTALHHRLDDPDAQVRMQLAYSLGAWDDRRAGDALARIALSDAEDPLMIAAVMSSASRFPEQMLRRVLDDRAPSEAQVTLIENLLRLVFEAEQNDALALGLQRIATLHGERYQQWQYTLLASLIDMIEYRGQSFQQFYENAPGALHEAVAVTARLCYQATKDAVNASRGTALRVQAMRLIGRTPTGEPIGPKRLADMLVLQTPIAVQIAVVNALARLEPPELPALLLDGWAQHGPDIRPRIVNVLLSREAWALTLLRSIEARDVAANELGAVNRSRLILHDSAQVRRLASQLMRASSPAQLLSTIERFRDKLNAPVDLHRGREVFRKHCAMCHRLENEGTNIGPDLLALTDRDPETLLVAILDPDRAVEPRYVEYSAVTMRGRVLAGIVATETGNSLTLIDAQGTEHKLARADVAELVSTGKSLMPVGVDQLLASDNDLLDLIAYVRSVEKDPASKRVVPTSHVERPSVR
ncbi:MAG: PVC-type heme-binding CxxCH protein [Pirellulales bacterium]